MEPIKNKQQEFFDFAAEVGLTKHIGGLQASRTLFGLCEINSESYVLDVGCGTGVTPLFLAKKVGCRVVGIDINQGMIRRSLQRAGKEGITDQVEFRVADAQELPFDDDTFDVVLTESVTAFPRDKQKAVNEYARVTRPGGYIGLNESTWLQVPPPPEILDWASLDIGTNVSPLTSAQWVGLLEVAGLNNIIAKTFEINLKAETKGILQRYGYGEMFRVLFRMLSLYKRSPDYRLFVKRVKREGITPKNLNRYFGYGLYVGRKTIAD